MNKPTITVNDIDQPIPFSLTTDACFLSAAMSFDYWSCFVTRAHPQMFSRILAGIGSYFSESTPAFWTWLILFVIAIAISGYDLIKYNHTKFYKLSVCGDWICTGLSILFSIFLLISL